MAPTGFGAGFGLPHTRTRPCDPPPNPSSGPGLHQTRHPPGTRDPMGTRERGGHGRRAAVLGDGQRRGSRGGGGRAAEAGASAGVLAGEEVDLRGDARWHRVGEGGEGVPAARREDKRQEDDHGRRELRRPIGEVAGGGGLEGVDLAMGSGHGGKKRAGGLDAWCVRAAWVLCGACVVGGVWCVRAWCVTVCYVVRACMVDACVVCCVVCVMCCGVRH